MITIFASPKPFNGHIGIIQRNAVASWRRLSNDVQIVLFGDEVGIEEAARDFGAQRYPSVAKNNQGTPLLSDMLRQAERMARHDIICFINSDIILMSDTLDAIKAIKSQCREFLMIGRCWNLDLSQPIDFAQANWERYLSGLVSQKGVRRDSYSIDYFVFPRGLYGDIPDFAIGRGWFDHWLVWKPRDLGAYVVNASQSVCVVHQNHDYAHVKGGVSYAHRGAEAQENFRLAGGADNMCSLHNATHKLVKGKLRRDIIGSYFPRWTRAYLETKLKMIIDAINPLRASLGIRR